MLILSNCKTGAWVRTPSVTAGRARARAMGWTDFTISAEDAPHGKPKAQTAPPSPAPASAGPAPRRRAGHLTIAAMIAASAVTGACALPVTTAPDRTSPAPAHEAAQDDDSGATAQTPRTPRAAPPAYGCTRSPSGAGSCGPVTP
jgi:hypothetical protein